MVQRNGSQLLLIIALCSVLYSRTVSLPYASMRPSRHADGLFTSGYSKLLGQLSARRYLESLIGKRVSDDMMEEPSPVKRHSDAIFTDNYSRFRKQMAVKKYLNSVLTGKRSQEDPPSVQEESTRSDSTIPESFEDVRVEDFFNRLQLPLWGRSIGGNKPVHQLHWCDICRISERTSTLTKHYTFQIRNNTWLSINLRFTLYIPNIYCRVRCRIVKCVCWPLKPEICFWQVLCEWLLNKCIESSVGLTEYNHKTLT